MCVLRLQDPTYRWRWLKHIQIYSIERFAYISGVGMLVIYVAACGPGTNARTNERWQPNNNNKYNVLQTVPMGVYAMFFDIRWKWCQSSRSICLRVIGIIQIPFFFSLGAGPQPAGPQPAGPQKSQQSHESHSPFVLLLYWFFSNPAGSGWPGWHIVR